MYPSLTLAIYLTLFSFLRDNKVSEVEKISISPKSITRLCPDHIGGDKEFNGHGPTVECWAKLEIRRDREVWVKIYLHAKETTKDHTECVGNWARRLYECESGKTIKRILTDESSDASYTDTNHELDAPAVNGGYLVSRFEVMGDTGGNDVGNCTSDDVYLNVYFNEMQIEVE